MTHRLSWSWLRTCVAAIVLAAGIAGASSTASATTPRSDANHTFQLTVLGTTDLHGHGENWDYFKNAEYDDSQHNDVGLAKVSSVVNDLRAQKGRDHTLLIDAGDTIQGTPLSTYYAKVDPITDGHVMHPMALAMNAIGYDAAAVGNHEFNYGIPLLDEFARQVNFPLLSANTIDDATGQPHFKPWIIKTINVPGDKPIRVGIVGFTTPGVALWDKHNVEGKLSFPGIVEQGRKIIPQVKAAGADIVIVTSHSGVEGTSSYGPDLPTENASALLAKEVPGIDAILVGHSHRDIPQLYVTNDQTGKQVLLSEPALWGERVSDMELTLTKDRGQWSVTAETAKTINTNAYPEDPRIVALLKPQHDTVVQWVNTPIGNSVQAMDSTESRYKDTPIIDLINQVQTDAVKTALAGTPEASLPVVSIAAPFSRTASFPAGPVSIRDVAGLYIYDNTLLAVKMTGAELKDYLEYSARYFNQLAPGAPVNVDTLTNAVTADAPTGIPDYNDDELSGISYDIDIAQPAGSRIENLRLPDGTPVAPDQEFVVAVNNYRESGGGGFPHVKAAPVLIDQQQDIRQLIIDWVTAKGAVDPAAFFSPSWQLTRNGVPLF
ncbi:MAG TPA: 5'-nucleotidase C-terminal domain-containing protein [Gaiellaceae bacterium]|nr:5'-nucleotidase C-terminal domain-containing protein [Gaiellaceae bacterium]